MAKITRQKCRKSVRCNKCGMMIEVGEEYLKGVPFHRTPICRHIGCGLRSWELSGSEFIQTCGSLQDDWQNNYEIGADTAQDIISTLEELRDTCQNSFDNMPENLQYSETGELLESRVDNIESVISELESVSDFDSILDDYINEHEEDEDFDEEEARENPPEEVIERLALEINDALSGLEY